MKVISIVVLGLIAFFCFGESISDFANAKSVMHQEYAAIILLCSIVAFTGLLVISVTPGSNSNKELKNQKRQEQWDKDMAELKANAEAQNKWLARADALLEAIEKNTRR